MKTIVLLAIANVFMTFAWYWHLRLENVALWKVVLISWGIAGIEYWFQVPANRIGTHQFNDFQLKLIQECLSLTVFCVFAVTYLHDKLRWNHLVSFALIFAAVAFMFKK